MASAIYETDRLVEQYLLFHYGTREEVLPWRFGPRESLDYPERCVVDCFDFSAAPRDARALDIGCAVGRSSFEFARYCPEVIGIDASHRFIETANRLAEQRAVEYRFFDEGRRFRNLTARVPDGVDPSRVSFEIGDAEDLSSFLGTFDFVLAANLLCRLKHPLRFLGQIADFLKPGGQLVINSPFSWSEEFTEPEQMIGASTDAGPSSVAVAHALRSHFVLERQVEMPFLIPEPGRKFQWTVACSQRFRREGR